MAGEGERRRWKGPLIFGAFVVFWFNFLTLFAAEPPSTFSFEVVPGLVFGALLTLGPVLAFLFLYVEQFREKGHVRDEEDLVRSLEFGKQRDYLRGDGAPRRDPW